MRGWPRYRGWAPALARTGLGCGHMLLAPPPVPCFLLWACGVASGWGCLYYIQTKRTPAETTAARSGLGRHAVATVAGTLLCGHAAGAGEVRACVPGERARWRWVKWSCISLLFALCNEQQRPVCAATRRGYSYGGCTHACVLCLVFAPRSDKSARLESSVKGVRCKARESKAQGSPPRAHGKVLASFHAPAELPTASRRTGPSPHSRGHPFLDLAQTPSSSPPCRSGDIAYVLRAPAAASRPPLALPGQSSPARCGPLSSTSSLRPSDDAASIDPHLLRAWRP